MSDRWVLVEGLDDRTLASAAVARALVRQKDGRIATLVFWPVHGRRRNESQSRGRSARLETRAGTRFKVHCDQIEAVQLPESP